MKKLVLFAGAVISLTLSSCSDEGWIGYYSSLSKHEQLFYDFFFRAQKEGKDFKVFSFENGCRFWVGEESFWLDRTEYEN